MTWENINSLTRCKSDTDIIMGDVCESVLREWAAGASVAVQGAVGSTVYVWFIVSLTASRV